MKKQRRRRILFVIPSLQGGGEERVALHLVNHLDRSRFEPMLALGEATGPYLQNVRADVAIHPLGAERAREAVPAIVRAVRSLRPHTVCSFLGFNFAVGLARSFFPSGTRVVLRQGNTTTPYVDEVESESAVRAWLYRGLFRSLYRRADRVICLCDYALNDMVDNFGVPRRKMARIYNPVDIANIRALTENEASPFRADGRGPHIVTAGNMLHSKGFDLLLPAFQRVREHYPHARLTIVGHGDNRPNLEAQARQLQIADAVRFAGFQSNPFQFMKHADLFVSSSRYEGFALVILEALACGTPVVATDCPSGNREVITPGTNGWLAPNANPPGLADTICRAIEELPNLDRAAIQADCESRFSIERFLSLHERQL